jgi:hypothetical protein
VVIAGTINPHYSSRRASVPPRSCGPPGNNRSFIIAPSTKGGNRNPDLRSGRLKYIPSPLFASHHSHSNPTAMRTVLTAHAIPINLVRAASHQPSHGSSA